MKGKAITFIAIMVISATLGAIMAVPNPISIDNGGKVPNASPLSNFSFTTGNQYIYRTWHNSSTQNNANDQYYRFTVLSIWDINSTHTNITFRGEKRMSLTYDIWVMDKVENRVYNINDNGTWWGSNFIPMNVNINTYIGYINSNLNQFFNQSGDIDSFISCTGTTNSLNVTGTKNGEYWSWASTFNTDLGILSYQVEIDENGTRVQELVKGTNVPVPTNLGVQPGNRLHYWVPYWFEENISTNIVQVDIDIRFIANVDGKTVVIVNMTFIRNDSTALAQPLQQMGRYIDGDPTSILDQSTFFYKTFDGTGMNSYIVGLLSAQGNTNVAVVSEAKYLSMAFTEPTGYRHIMQFQYPADSSTGCFNYRYEEKSDGRKMMWVLKEGPGVKDDYTQFNFLGLGEGDTFEYLNQRQYYYRNDSGTIHEEFSENYMGYEKYEITHIFQMNHSVAVFGNLYKAETRNPTIKVAQFIPILVCDGSLSLKFVQLMEQTEKDIGLGRKVNLNDEDLRDKDGGQGPKLFPTNLVLSDISTEIEALVLQDREELEGESLDFFETTAHAFTASIYGEKLIFSVEITENHGCFKFMNQRVRIENETFTRNKQEKLILVDVSQDCGSVEEDNWGVSEGDELIWERSSSEEPSDKQWSKTVIGAIVDTCGGYTVMFGQRFNKYTNPPNTEMEADIWYPNTWCLNQQWDDSTHSYTCDKQINAWILGMFERNNPRSWWESQIMPIDVMNNLGDYRNDILWLFNAMLAQVDDGELVIGDHTITVTMEDVTWKIAFNDQGVMQDMLQIKTVGTTTYWQREVLVAGPGDLGESFENPDGYIPADILDEDLDENLFDIPGFSVGIIGIISFAAVCVLFKKYNH